MTLACALLRAWSRISMCLRWSSLAERTAASSISSFSFSFKCSLSGRKTWTGAIPAGAHKLGHAPEISCHLHRKARFVLSSSNWGHYNIELRHHGQGVSAIKAQSLNASLKWAPAAEMNGSLGCIWTNRACGSEHGLIKQFCWTTSTFPS